MNNMMFNALLLVVGVGLVSADFTCPDGIVKCAEGKDCCYQSGSGYSCCDKPENDANLIPGVRSSWQTFPNQSLPSTPQHVPSLNLFDYCPYTTGRRFCCFGESLTNCYENSECCSDGERCCQGGYNCCGEWCCIKGSVCGTSFMTCKNGAATLAARGLAVMVAVALAVLKFARI